MSDHFDTDDPRTDLTDLYVFPASAAGRSVLVLDFNPEPGDQDVPFDTAASYELKIDADGDAEADVAFHVLFSSSSGRATATLYRSTGSLSRESGPVGAVVIDRAPVSLDGEAQVTEANEYRFFAGIRSDPHFKDAGARGLAKDFIPAGRDLVAGLDVLAIVLEVPTAAMAANGQVGLWARTVVRLDGTPRVVDQAGRPATNNTFNGPESDRLEFNETPPAEQLSRFDDRFLAVLRSLGYSDAEAGALLPGLLPDMLFYDPTERPGYPNGRRLEDDTADAVLTLITRGRVTSDGIGPHTDLLSEFPYLGPPHLASAT